MTSLRLLALALILGSLEPAPSQAQTPDTGLATFNFATWNPWALRAQIRLIPEPTRRPAPHLDLPVWDSASRGKDHLQLKSLEGKVVVLDFWNRSCPPCLPLHETLAQLAPRWRSQGVEILSILSEDPPTGLAAFLQAHGGPPPFPILLDPKGEALNSFGSYGFPTVVLVDHYGRVALERLPGSGRIRELEAYFPALLAARARP